MLPDDAIVIADRSTAGSILCSPRKRQGLAYVVSIGGPQERPPAGFRQVDDRLRLVFEDEASEAEGGPSPEDVDRLIHFARHVDLAKGRVLVHCQAGVSRSSAAAAILLAVVLGPNREQDAVQHVLKSHPPARPNVRMLELADAALGTGGALVRALGMGIVSR